MFHEVFGGTVLAMSIRIHHGVCPSVVAVPRRGRRRSGVFAAIVAATLTGGTCLAGAAGASPAVGGVPGAGADPGGLKVLAGVDGLPAAGRDGTAGSPAREGASADDGPSPTSVPVQQAVDGVVAAGAVGALARVRDGRGVVTAVAGQADRATGRLLSADDQFEIGSNTKTMMATIVLQLVGEGRLRLTDSVEKLLPGVVPGGEGITVRMLLQHTSGLYNYTDDPDLLKAFFQDPTARHSPEELVAGAMEHPALFEPGARWSYSNTNYLLVGMILQKVTGRSPDRLLQERIARPLGLHRTYLVTHLAGDTGPGYAHGYFATFTGSGSTPEIRYNDVSGWSLSWAWTAGAVVSTAPELSRFLSALLGGELLPAARLADMLTTVPMDDDGGSGYGLGIARTRTPCGTVWGHTGGTVGHSSHMFGTAGGRRTVVTDSTTIPDGLDGPGATDRARAMASADEALFLTGLCRMQGRDLPGDPVPSHAPGTSGS